MSDVLRACVGTLVVVVVPGLLVASVLGLRLRTLSTWAAIPAFSLATVFLLGEITTLVRAPFGVPAFAVLLLMLAGVLGLRRSRGSAVSRWPQQINASTSRTPIDRRLGARVEYALLALGVGVGALTWFRGLRGVPLVPPGADATRHGWMVARIIHGHTIDPSRLLTYDVGGLHHDGMFLKFYPLGFHAAAALSTRLVGSDVGRVLVAYIVVFSAVVLPVGMFVLARTLAPSRPLVAGFAALVVPLMVLYPYEPVWNGDIPQIVAMAMVPMAVVLLRQAMLARRPRPQLERAFVLALVPASLAIFCAVAVHTSELPLIVFLVLLLVLERAWRKHNARMRMLRSALVRGGAVGVLAVALYSPTLLSAARGVSQLENHRLLAVPSSGWAAALGPILELRDSFDHVRQVFLAVLALAGAALWLLRRRPAWMAGWVSIVFLTLLASASTNGLASQLTAPWYHYPARIVVNVAYFVPFFAGVALAHGVVLITRLARRSSAFLPATVAMVTVLTVFVGLQGSRGASAYIRASFDPTSRSFKNQAVVDHNSLAAFKWLRAHAAHGDTVANEPFVDGSLWMYAQQGVAPLVGLYDYRIPIVTKSALRYAFGVPPPSPELNDRLYLAYHVQWLGTNARADALARRYHTRWVFVDRRQFAWPFIFRATHVAALKRNPNLTLVFHRGGAFVFRNDRAGP